MLRQVLGVLFQSLPTHFCSFYKSSSYLENDIFLLNFSISKFIQNKLTIINQNIFQDRLHNIFSTTKMTEKIPLIGKIRTSALLTSNSERVLTNYLKDNNITSNQFNISYFTRADGLPYTTARIFPGPKPHHRIVTIVRNITGIPQSKFIGVYLIDMSKIDKIDHQILYQKISDRNLKIRNIVSSPNRKQLLLIYDQYIQKFKIQPDRAQKQKDAKVHTLKPFNINNQRYTLSQSSSVFLGQFKQSIAAVYGPSGEVVYGIRYVKQTENSSLYVYKLMTRNMTYVQKLVDNTCIVGRDYVFMSPWVLEVDSRQIYAFFATYYNNSACLFQTNNLKITNSKPDSSFQQFYINDFINENYTNSTGYSASVGFVNIAEKRMLYYDDFNKAHYFQSSRNNDKQYGHLVIFSQKTAKKAGEIKCIEIEQLYAFACIKHTLSSIYINKKYSKKFFIQNLLEIKNDNPSNRPQDLLIQDIFYYAPTNQLCIYISNTIKCHELLIKCTQNSTAPSPLNFCDDQCKDINTELYWSPQYFTCKKCLIQSCNCRLYKYVYERNFQQDSYKNQCSTLDCSKIDFAVAYSEYASLVKNNNYWTFSMTKCACQPPYTWSQKLRYCRLDCSIIKHTQVVEPSQLKIDQCKCEDRYEFVKTQDQMGGICRFVCPNKQYASDIGSKNICECQRNQIWDPYLQECVRQKAQQKNNGSRGMPAWGIALIIFFILLLLGICLFYLWKRYRKNNKKGLVTRESVNSQDTDRRKLPKTQQNMKQNEQHSGQNLCSICKKQEEVNCKGPCNHVFHFDCINSRLKQGINYCPYCSAQFPKGISDLVMMQKKQVFSIGEENQNNE